MRMIQNKKLSELKSKWKDGIFFASMVVLFGLLLFSRIYKLDELQQGLAIDEVGSAYDAFSLSHYGVDRWEKSWPVYPNNHGNGMSAMHTFLLAALFKILPMNLWTVRTPVVLFSILNWIFGILIMKELSENNKTAQYLAALVMTVCPIFVLTSRMGLDCYLMLGGSTVLLWSFIRLYKDNSAKWYFISGLFSGLFLYTYVITYIVLPLFLVAIFLMMILVKRMSWKKLLLFFLPPLLFLAIPLILEQMINLLDLQEIKLWIFTIPKMNGYRSDEIGHFSLDNMDQVIKAVFWGEESGNNMITGYMPCYAISVLFFGMGMFSYLKKIVQCFRERKICTYGIVFFYFMICILALSFVQEPNVHKCIGAYSAYGLIAAEGLLYFCENIGLKKTALVLVSGVYLLCFVKFERYYLFHYPLEISPSPYCEYDQTDAVEFIVNNEKICNKITYTSADILYVAYATQIPPQEYNARTEAQDLDLWKCGKLVEISREFNYIVSTDFQEYAQQLRQEGFYEEKFEHYSVFYTE